MDSNLKYRRPFLIIAYGILLQFLILPFLEFSMLLPNEIKLYVVSKVSLALFLILFIVCVHRLRFIKYWVGFFYFCCFAFALVGQYFTPGYHFVVIQFMFVCAIVFEGFPFMSTLLMIIFMIQYSLQDFSNTTFPDYPLYHRDVYITLFSSWVIAVVLERYVNRVKFKQNFLDRKLRYKGIKTDLFLHDLKNKLQPLISLSPHQSDFKEIVKTIQAFNSFKDEEEIYFSEVVKETKKKFNIKGECFVSGSEDFFIDQMDLQTILCNLMNNSAKAAELKNISLQMYLRNTQSGFSYEDNAGGMTEEQYKFFAQKDLRPYVGHEKNGLGLLLIKKLVEHHEGKFLIKRIPNGTRFEITY